MRDQVLSIDQMKHLKDLDIDTSEAVDTIQIEWYE